MLGTPKLYLYVERKRGRHSAPPPFLKAFLCFEALRVLNFLESAIDISDGGTSTETR